MHALLTLWVGWIRDWGYAGVVILMAMESSIFPVPSEVVVPPAAYLTKQGQMTFWGVVIAGTVGSWLGAAITYWASRALGRLVLVRWGKWFLMSEEKLSRAEHWLERYEAGGIFFARLLPVVRHLISIPAGIVRMKFGVFSLMTVVGSFLWCTVLAWYGEKVITAEMLESPEGMIRAVKSQSLWLIAFVALVCALYFVVMRLTDPERRKAAKP
jgi:membrane protein DedA with SNARE-associated domain